MPEDPLLATHIFAEGIANVTVMIGHEPRYISRRGGDPDHASAMDVHLEDNPRLLAGKLVHRIVTRYVTTDCCNENIVRIILDGGDETGGSEQLSSPGGADKVMIEQTRHELAAYVGYGYPDSASFNTAAIRGSLHFDSRVESSTEESLHESRDAG